MSPEQPFGPSDRCLEIQRLLPWYTQETLEPQDRAGVERHLESCLICEAEAAHSRALGAAVAADGPASPKPHPRELARLLARVDFAEERWPRRLLAWRGPFWWHATPRAMRLVMAAQVILAFALAGLLARSWTTRPGAVVAPTTATYRTLSESPAAPYPPRRLRVMFDEEASEKVLRQLLLPLDAQIVSGPSPLGVYTLTVPGGAAAASEAVVLAHLRSRPEVRFVEPLEPEARP